MRMGLAGAVQTAACANSCWGGAATLRHRRSTITKSKSLSSFLDRLGSCADYRPPFTSGLPLSRLPICCKGACCAWPLSPIAVGKGGLADMLLGGVSTFYFAILTDRAIQVGNQRSLPFYCTIEAFRGSPLQSIILRLSLCKM